MKAKFFSDTQETASDYSSSVSEKVILEKGFLLAYFIFPDRTTALQILLGALNKVKAQCSHEDKRAYWRDKFLKNRITRISRNSEDTLQWLIYLEADSYEKAQEQSGECVSADLVVRFVKTLARVGIGFSSFYLNIALYRLLYSYNTSESQHIYELLTDCYIGADEYRRAKRFLMNRVDDRFGKLLRTIRIEHGETRYEPDQDQGTWQELVLCCLEMFTPWSTKRTNNINLQEAALTEHLQGLNQDFLQKFNQDEIEINRCHILMDPICAENIVKTLGLPSCQEKLAVPRFYMDTNNNEPEARQPSNNKLSQQEREFIEKNLIREATRRKQVKPEILRFLVDGHEYSSLTCKETGTVFFDLDEPGRILEIWTEDQKGPLLLATHLIPQENANFPSLFELALQGGVILNVTIFSTVEETGESKVRISANAQKRRFLPKDSLWDWLRQGTTLVPNFALVSCALLLLVSLAAVVGYRHYEDSLQEVTTTKLLQAGGRSIPVMQAQNEATVYRLIPDDSITRGYTIQKRQVSINLNEPLFQLEFPAPDNRGSYKMILQTFIPQKTILTEKLPEPLSKDGHWTISVSLPSSLLKPGVDYTVILQDTKRSIVISSFTFHTSQQSNRD